MARRKQNRGRTSVKGKNRKQTIIAILLVVVIFAVLLMTSQLPNSSNKEAQDVKSISENVEKRLEEVKPAAKPPVKAKYIKTPKKANATAINTPANFELPKLDNTKYLYHNREGRYKVNYDPQNKIPLFVAHILTKDEVSQRGVERSSSFTGDRHYSRLGVVLATNDDYSRSGYDRGHMVPSADRNDSKVENKATFNLSNIAPQLPALNRQTINQLEQQIREWALKHDSLFIVTGCILRDNDSRPIKRIGDGVAVPQYFYKVVAMRHNGEFKSVGFLMPNISGVDSDYNSYITTVDKIEQVANIDLYYNLPDIQEKKMESEIDNSIWH